MPWCDDCDRFLSPNTVRDDGTCPECGSPIITPRALERARRGRGATADARAVRDAREAVPGSDAPADGSAGETAKTPWHFKVLLVALILYLGWRLVQGIGWVTGHL